ncbi:hypothetical protein INT45_009402 [Circinella minor]|uniref:Uncharacterized protein n=1 Tax=Circinella minor TaxID=1195481 RepID=A0A8H7RW02_9FUNG|nr:hypothetical protein INT45_009402 [Circinella minor]
MDNVNSNNDNLNIPSNGATQNLTISLEAHHSNSTITTAANTTRTNFNNNLGGPMRRAHRTSTPRYNPTGYSSLSSSSTSSFGLSGSDRTFIDFTRCLYQTKSIVKGLQQFSNSICPALRLSPFNGHSASSSLRDPRLSSEEFVRHVNQYLDNTFQKISRLCKMLLLILARIEQSNAEVKRERIDSFRTEVWEQMSLATYTKETLIGYIQQHIDSAATPHSRNSNSSSSTSSPKSFSGVTSPINNDIIGGGFNSPSPSPSTAYPPTSSAV